MYYLGVDSGGTKASFVLGDETGKVYARYLSTGCCVLGARKAGVKAKMEEGISNICQAAHIDRSEIAGMALGISGYGEGKGSEEETLEACEEVLAKGKAVCQCDTYIGWAGSFLFQPGINIISGTGAVVYGVNREGKAVRSNGWGAGCDEGSCTWLGHKLVETFTKQADGRMERTNLYRMFCEKYGIDGNDEHYVQKLNREVVYGIGLPKLQLFLKEIWETGDPIARRIYEEGIGELWMGVESVARKLGLSGEDYRVSYSGGLFKGGDCALIPLKQKAWQTGAHLVQPIYEPDIGALMWAIKQQNPDFNPETFNVMEESK